MAEDHTKPIGSAPSFDRHLPAGVSSLHAPTTTDTDRSFSKIKRGLVDAFEKRNRMVWWGKHAGGGKASRLQLPDNPRGRRRAGRNAVGGTKLRALDAQLEEWLERLVQFDLPADLTAAVHKLERLVETHGAEEVPLAKLKTLVSLQDAIQRDTIYVMFGFLGNQKPGPQIRQFGRALDGFKAKGYRVVEDLDTTYSEWKAYMSAPNTAGVVWLSQGWVDHEPNDLDPNHFESRVLMKRAPAARPSDELPLAGRRRKRPSNSVRGFSQPPKKVFATEWAERSPDKLAFQVIVACGSGGVTVGFHAHCENHNWNTPGLADRPSRLISFYHTIRHKAFLTITYEDEVKSITEGYLWKDLVDTLYDRRKGMAVGSI